MIQPPNKNPSTMEFISQLSFESDDSSRDSTDKVSFNNNKKVTTTLRKRKKSAEVYTAGTSGVFRQKSFATCDRQLTDALASCARAARQSIGNIGYLIARRMAAGGISPPLPWSNCPEDYDLRHVIGMGATAIVQAAICKPRQEKCAIKRINLETWNSSLDELNKEILTMSNCNHENVLTYYTSFVFVDELWLVLKLLDCGSLLDIIKIKQASSKCENGVFEEAIIATILKDVLKGMKYLHKNGNIHRDLKAGNILIGEDGSIQIGDFGVSAQIANGRDLSRSKARHTFVGTPCWMAPEVMEQDRGYDFKADIWSFGITAIEMATGYAPYHKYPPMKVLMLTLQNDAPTLDTGSASKDQYKDYGKSLRKMIADCLQKDPTKRPTAEELLKHKFFKKAKDKRYLITSLAPFCPKLKENILKGMKTGEQPSTSESSSGTSSRKSSTPDDKTLTLVLTIRNKENMECSNIRFEYSPSTDSPHGIATELEVAGLIQKSDINIIGDSLKIMISKGEECKEIVFPLNEQWDKVDEEMLIGFAKLSWE